MSNSLLFKWRKAYREGRLGPDVAEANTGSCFMPDTSNVSYPWIYGLVGYVILVKAVIAILGKNLTQWATDSFFYLLFMATGMRPVKWLAKLLLKENYWAQAAAKSPFMGVYMAGTMSDAPRDLRSDYDKIYKLYMKSNDEEARRELEKLCAKY